MFHLIASMWLVAAPPAHDTHLACLTVHGRMFLSNGTPSVRIWVIDTRRVLGVMQQDETFDQLPANIRQAWPSKDGGLDDSQDLYGDFSVCPESRRRRGEMQFVWVRAGKNLLLKPAR